MFPLIAFHKNILFTTQGEAYALYRMPGQPYHFLPLEHRRAAVARFEELLFGLEGKGQILLLWEEKDVDEGGYLAVAAPDLATAPAWRKEEAARHARAARAALNRGARIRRRYLAVQLPLRREEGWGSLAEAAREAGDAALSLFTGLRPEYVPPKKVEMAKAAEDELGRRLRGYGLKKAEFADVDFIVRRAARRYGLLPPPLPSRDEGRFTPGMIAAFAEGAYVEEKIDCVVVRDGTDRGHAQAFVTFADVPKRLRETEDEFLSVLDFLGDPVDAVIHFEIIQPYKAAAKVRGKRAFLKGQMDEAYSGGGEPTEAEELGLHDSRRLEAKVEAGQPLARVGICFAVPGPDAKTAAVAANRLVQRFSSRGFRAVRPSGIQLKCFYSFLPGAPPGAPMVECDPGYVAAAGPMAAAELGDPKGFFLGWSGPAPVFWSPGRPALELNKTNAVLITGSLGGGKSVGAKTLAYYVLLAGGVGFAVDPKNEYHVFRRIFPTRRIDLSPRGGTKLNPFTLSADEQRAKAIALDYLALALNVGENEARRVAVAQAVEMVFSLPPEKRDMDAVLGVFRMIADQSPHQAVKEEAGQCALLIEYLRASDVGSLVFGRAADAAAAGSAAGSIVFTTVNLKELPLPRRGASAARMTESERQGLALMYLAAAMAREMAFGLPPGILKCLVFDEAWMLFAVPEGQRLLEEIVRVGRSFNVVPVLISQNASDFLESKVIVNNVSNVFCFRASDAEEVEADLRFLGADPEALDVRFFAGMESGTAVFRDAEDRIGVVHIDPQPPYLLELFDTRPKGEAKKEN